MNPCDEVQKSVCKSCTSLGIRWDSIPPCSLISEHPGAVLPVPETTPHTHCKNSSNWAQALHGMLPETRCQLLSQRKAF
eukprot:1513940-Amphidinium_carterae.1